MGQRIPVPLLTTVQIRTLRQIEKPVPNDWRARLLPQERKGDHTQGTLALRLDAAALPAGGRCFLYSRQGSRDDNYSVGLVYEDEDGHQYHVVRCNGPDHLHLNRRAPAARLPLRPHVHYLTEAYQHGRGFHIDGFALVGPAFTSILTAMDVLATKVNLVAPQPPLPFRLRSLG